MGVPQPTGLPVHDPGRANRDRTGTVPPDPNGAPPGGPLVVSSGRGRPAATTVPVAFRINGLDQHLDLDPRVTLLDALREGLGLTGAKKGCDRSECGACTVLVDGRRVNACLTLAVMHRGAAITTIEGLARDGAPHPVQDAFVEHDALQCGFCTPGQILSAVALLAEGQVATDDAIREGMSGNLCRCAAYPNIVAAIRHVAAAEGPPPGEARR